MLLCFYQMACTTGTLLKAFKAVHPNGLIELFYLLERIVFQPGDDLEEEVADAIEEYKLSRPGITSHGGELVAAVNTVLSHGTMEREAAWENFRRELEHDLKLYDKQKKRLEAKRQGWKVMNDSIRGWLGYIWPNATEVSISSANNASSSGVDTSSDERSHKKSIKITTGGCNDSSRIQSNQAIEVSMSE
jgi:hypothetical protein